MIKDAVISNCGDYRYALWRIWDSKLPKVMFIMLNPSTADANEDDPTIRRCINFARAWGYGGLYVGNIYAYRATNPKDLAFNGYLIGEHNSKSLLYMAEKCDKIICAWGNNINRLENPIHILKSMGIGDKLHYLRLAKTGQPCHPLYLPSDLVPIKL